MARYTGAKCRICRREGRKIFLKGERCLSPKCPVEKKGAVPPGKHGLKGARKPSSFALQMREKQKAKRTYQILERQFRNYVQKATQKKVATAQALLEILERRLDNVVYRLGFTPSRSVARQIVNHGHVTVGSRKVKIPSYLVGPEDLISLDKKTQAVNIIKKLLEDKKYQPPSWLARKGPVGKVLRLPTREDIQTDISEQLITEYYSR